VLAQLLTTALGEVGSTLQVLQLVWDSTCLDAEPASVEGLIVQGEVCSEYGHLFLEFAAFFVDVIVLHDFGVSCPVVQLVYSLGKCVELVPWGCEEIAKLERYRVSHR